MNKYRKDLNGACGDYLTVPIDLSLLMNLTLLIIATTLCMILSR